MPPLRRHQLAYLSAAGWQAVLEQDWDHEGLQCLQHWSDHGLPLVVTRQPVLAKTEPVQIALGLSAPAAWGRRLLRLQLPVNAIGWFGEFPLLPDVLPLVPRGARAVIQSLAEALAAIGVRAHAYGGVGWQRLTSLRYLHARSDLDLWLAVDDEQAADAAVMELSRHVPIRLRIDGEIMFSDGSAVAWREWDAWRVGRSRAVLVKQLNGASVENRLPFASTRAPMLAQAA
jgi:phosphoribosyl-dephospho-CoA transferase